MLNKMALKIIFAGTPEFAIPTLQALLNSEHQICAVYTQPDRPAGRGQKLTASAVKQLAVAHQLPVYQPVTLRDATVQQILRNFNADIMIVIAYGLILPKAVLTIPRYGCVNVHASLLPHWRGAAPIQRAILNGDKLTGITIMQMDEGLDTGEILQQENCSIHDDDTSASLQERLAKLGATALLEALTKIESNSIQQKPQDNALTSHAAKISKAEAELDWHLSAIALDRKIRAFNPWPVAYTLFQQQPLRIWQAKALPEKSSLAPGTLIHADKSGIDVATGEGILRILQLQLPNGPRISPNDFVNARKNVLLPQTTRFGAS